MVLLAAGTLVVAGGFALGTWKLGIGVGMALVVAYAI
jgi:hypothetical protein